MRIPGKPRERAEFCADLIHQCSNSRSQRIQRGAAYRSIFYTGNPDGIPQTFLRTQDLVRDLQAFLYSSADLRFSLDFYGTVSPAVRAKGKAAAAHLYEQTRKSRADRAISKAVLGGLIKGKTIYQTVYSRNGFEPYIIQPELFGVEREDLETLDRQSFFTHTTFLSKARFRQMIGVLPDKDQAELMKGVTKFAKQANEGDNAAANSALKQIMVGGLYPYTTASSPPNTSGGQVLNWLVTPQPMIRPDVIEELIPYDELWVWDDDRDDWATMTLVGDMMVFGRQQNYNAFAESVKTGAKRDGVELPDTNNPLRGKHGFVEFCPLPMEDYFWGYSVVALVSLLQLSLNNRIDGINTMLRIQEDPPRIMTGSTAVNQNAYAKLKKPGGYYTDGNPNAKINEITKPIPPDVWNSFHELNAMIDVVAGFPASTKGEGEAGVRSQGHADRLVQMGTARHKEPALEIEGSVEEVAGLMLDILRARDTTILTGWVMPSVKSIETDLEPDPSLEPPAEGMQAISFQLHHLPENVRVTTDGHSQSPAFSQEAKLTAIALAKQGAMPPKRLVESLHPPNADAIEEDLDQAEIAHEKLIAVHPELLEKGGKRKAH
jgi:hypothetical protein